jgi:hypothetical protein
MISAVLSGLFAALTASLVSTIIEKYGGRIGGILGSSPTTIVPAVIGIWMVIAQDLNQQKLIGFQKSMFIIPASST